MTFKPRSDNNNPTNHDFNTNNNNHNNNNTNENCKNQNSVSVSLQEEHQEQQLKLLNHQSKDSNGIVMIDMTANGNANLLNGNNRLDKENTYV